MPPVTAPFRCFQVISLAQRRGEGPCQVNVRLSGHTGSSAFTA
jgi:hypothetical protein